VRVRVRVRVYTCVYMCVFVTVLPVPILRVCMCEYVSMLLVCLNACECARMWSEHVVCVRKRVGGCVNM